MSVYPQQYHKQSVRISSKYVIWFWRSMQNERHIKTETGLFSYSIDWTRVMLLVTPRLQNNLVLCISILCISISCRNPTQYRVKMAFLSSLELVWRFVSFSEFVWKFGNSSSYVFQPTLDTWILDTKSLYYMIEKKSSDNLFTSQSI